MRNFIVNRNILTSFAIAVTALWLSMGFALGDSPTLKIETVQSATKDDSFAAEVNIENITNLAGYQLEIAFDPAILEAVKVEKGSFVLNNDMVCATDPEINNDTGLITKIVYVKPGQDGASGSGAIVIITFNAIGLGESYIRLQNVKLLDPSLPEPQEIPVTIVDASVDVVLPDPVVSDIPDQTIEEGGTFASISLDEYVADPDNEDSEIAWTYTGNSDLSVSISDTRVATITVPDPEWSGSETITFTATDPGELSDSDTAIFTVTAVNDPPVVSDIPDQTIEEGDTFADISLDDYVADPDNEAAEIVWTYTGNVDLSVSISDARVATIAVPDPEWNGSETITFTATDPGELSGSDAATFTVAAVNEPPVVSDIPDQTIVQGDAFASISLDDYVADPDNEAAEIVWTYTGNVDLSVSISDARVATIAVPTPEWFGSETITFTATDPGELSDSKDASFTVLLLGDVNNDGAVRSNDAILSLRFAAGLQEPTEDEKWAADMNGDGEIKADDAILILRKAAGLSAPSADYVASSAGPVTITSTEAHGVAGGSVTVPLKVDNFAGLAGGDIRIAYDPAVLRAVDVLPGSAKSKVLLVANLAEPGMVHISFAGSDSLSSKALASIKFEVLADDVSPLTFKSVGFYGFNALPLASRGVDEVFRSWAIPAEYSDLLQNFPNPFNPETWVPFQLKESSEVTIRIYNASGNLVRELDLGYRPAGLYVSQDRAAYWDGMTNAGERVSSGVYFYNIQAVNYSATRKMIVVR